MCELTSYLESAGFHNPLLKVSQSQQEKALMYELTSYLESACFHNLLLKVSQSTHYSR